MLLDALIITCFCFNFRVFSMEDTQEIDEVQEEVISDKTSEKEEETRDEVLARHR